MYTNISVTSQNPDANIVHYTDAKREVQSTESDVRSRNHFVFVQFFLFELGTVAIFCDQLISVRKKR